MSPPSKKIGVLSEMFPPKPTWTSADVPSMKGRVVIVTGGNAGIGKETCRVLLNNGAKVYLAARSESKANEAIRELEEKTGKKAIFLRLDLADLPSVRKAAEDFLSKEQQLHVLFNNGGVMGPPLGDLTAQGYDAQFGINVLGHFFFTKLLIPVLLSTAKGNPNGTPCKVRVITTSSNGHDLLALPGGINWDTLQKGDVALPARKQVNEQGLYGQSKLGNILIANELAKRYGDQGIVAISLHPGSVKTDLQRYLTGSFIKWLMGVIVNLLVYDVSLGAITQLYAGTSPEAENMNGEYLTSWARPQIPHKNATDPVLREKLWSWCEEQVKGF